MDRVVAVTDEIVFWLIQCVLLGMVLAIDAMTVLWLIGR